MRVAIVGNESAKFTEATEDAAKVLIYDLLTQYPDTILVSGHCHLGGIDIWAEEIANALEIRSKIFPPAYLSWEAGYKPRNIQIADECDLLHNIVVAQYPSTYSGMRFNSCYHCHGTDHVKSGGCWTRKYAERLGKPAFQHILS